MAQVQCEPLKTVRFSFDAPAPEYRHWEGTAWRPAWEMTEEDHEAGRGGYLTDAERILWQILDDIFAEDGIGDASQYSEWVVEFDMAECRYTRKQIQTILSALADHLIAGGEFHSQLAPYIHNYGDEHYHDPKPRWGRFQIPDCVRHLVKGRRRKT